MGHAGQEGGIRYQPECVRCFLNASGQADGVHYQELSQAAGRLDQVGLVVVQSFCRCPENNMQGVWERLVVPCRELSNFLKTGSHLPFRPEIRQARVRWGWQVSLGCVEGDLSP